MSKDLQDYISQALKKGFSDKDIYDQLVAAGWKSSIVAEQLGLSVPKGQQVDDVNTSDIVLPVVLRIIGIIFFVIVWYVFRMVFALGGNSFQPEDHIPFFFMSYLPIILIALSILSLIAHKGSYPFDFIPHKKIRSIARRIVIVIIWMYILFISFVYIDHHILHIL